MLLIQGYKHASNFHTDHLEVFVFFSQCVSLASDLSEIIKFVKPAPIDQEMSKKSKKQQDGGKKKKQGGGGDQNLPNAMETMSVDDS